jgi:hypothetical protein
MPFSPSPLMSVAGRKRLFRPLELKPAAPGKVVRILLSQRVFRTLQFNDGAGVAIPAQGMRHLNGSAHRISLIRAAL